MRYFVIQKIIFVFILFFALYPTKVLGQKTGKASIYSSRLQGRHTSDGGKYYPDSLTCAHLTYPFGTLLQVRNPKNNKVVIVKVTDRGPHSRNRLIDLSYAAAKELDIIKEGIATVEITKIEVLPELIRLIPIPRVYVQISPLRFLIPKL